MIKVLEAIGIFVAAVTLLPLFAVAIGTYKWLAFAFLSFGVVFVIYNIYTLL